MENKGKNDGTGTFGCLLVFIGIALIIFGKLFGLAAIALGALLFWLSWGAANADYDKKVEERKLAKRQPVVSVQVTTSNDGEDDDLTFSIKGINFRDLDDSYLGDFTGTAKALRSNPHDPYAVGIYIGSRRVGFIPGGNAEVHALIIRNGGSVDASGFIAKGQDETDGRYFYWGKVTLHPLLG